MPGKVRKQIRFCCQAKCGSITLNFDKKCPGWTLLNSALEPTQVFHLQTMGEMTKLSTVAVYQLYDTMHMLCHVFGQMLLFTRIVSHFSWNVGIYALCRIFLTQLYTIRVAGSPRIGVGPGFDSQGSVTFFHKYCFPNLYWIHWVILGKWFGHQLHHPSSLVDKV